VESEKKEEKNWAKNSDLKVNLCKKRGGGKKKTKKRKEKVRKEAENLGMGGGGGGGIKRNWHLAFILRKGGKKKEGPIKENSYFEERNRRKSQFENEKDGLAKEAKEGVINPVKGTS